MHQRAHSVLLLAILTSAPVAAIAVWSLGRTVTVLSQTDPCVQWQAAGEVTATLPPGGPCRSLTVHGQSKTRAAITAILVPGGVLAAAVLAVSGIAASRRKLAIPGSGLMLAETAVAMTLFPLTLSTGVILLLLARRVPQRA